ncbi:hypothetical protein B0H13DRAFT_1976280 [Mycena leptocephala]|nr:hypothetical protein B0H13DRAFT_1976280 [Mycena leptocephala]
MCRSCEFIAIEPRLDVMAPSASSHSPNTAVAMIVLYTVTGCVSLLFCIIIISGIFKARARNRNRGQTDSSGARGLTRAILDTFPIVKFGTNTPETQDPQIEDTHPDPGIHLPDTNTRQSTLGQSVFPSSEASTSGAPLTLNPSENNTRTTFVPIAGAERTELPAMRPTPTLDLIPAAIGRETCPICIVDFEEGDDLRVLPCDGAHRFHQSCVDPWLLALSTECPLCRHDFIALENMISGGFETQVSDSNQRNSRLRRFSRYLRFARHGVPARSSLSTSEDDSAPRSSQVENSQL